SPYVEPTSASTLCGTSSCESMESSYEIRLKDLCLMATLQSREQVKFLGVGRSRRGE
ncbi:hypothetical protein M9458_056565, partial [Cirrhinus mrigala]